MDSKDPEVSEQGAAGKRKYVTLTVPWELEIIRGLESGKYQIVVCLLASWDHQQSVI